MKSNLVFNSGMIDIDSFAVSVELRSSLLTLGVQMFAMKHCEIGATIDVIVLVTNGLDVN